MTSDMATYYFAYGADMDSHELDQQHDRRRRPRIRFADSAPAILNGYRLSCNIASKHRRAGIFNVVPDPKSRVHGVAYKLHPGDTISISVLKEGDTECMISLLPVKTKKGDEIQAMVLHAKVEGKTLVPSAAYIDIVVKAAQKHKLSSEWIEQLESFRTAAV